MGLKGLGKATNSSVPLCLRSWVSVEMQVFFCGKWCWYGSDRHIYPVCGRVKRALCEAPGLILWGMSPWGVQTSLSPPLYRPQARSVGNLLDLIITQIPLTPPVVHMVDEQDRPDADNLKQQLTYHCNTIWVHYQLRSGKGQEWMVL